jgi:hypothetical protein
MQQPDEIDQLKAEIKRLEQENQRLGEIVRRAKDPTPVQRPSLKRVIELVQSACMTLERCGGGWLLKLGHRVRRFRFLKQIWELLIADDWLLEEVFPPEPEQLKIQPQLPERHPVLAKAASRLPVKRDQYGGMR